jgi:hypothetical protein
LKTPVKLPKEVLNLFPTWEYRCPSCGTYAESNISFCPRCKTAFDEKRWRVPPRFLKSHEAMSEYAHKVLAPQLSPKQRDLLFQYFTELFSDGFESGDFSEWTGTDTKAGCSITASTDYAHHGSYSAEAYLDGNQVDDHAWVYKALSPANDDTYTRLYFYFPSLPSGTSRGVHVVEHETDSGSGYRGLVGILDDSGTTKLHVVIRFDEMEYRQFEEYSFSAETWYCLELRTKRETADGNDDGIFQVWIDGELAYSLTEVGNYGQGNVDRVNVGGHLWWTSPTVESTVYVDCVVVADTYIGEEEEGATYTKTWQTDVLFKKLGIAKTLNVDVAFRKQNIPKTFGLDSTFQKSFVIQKQIDALFKKLGILETFGVDIGFLKRNVVKSFAVDARFGALITQTISRQIDVLIKKLDAAKTFGLDVYFGPVESETYAKSFGLNVIFAYKVRLPELWLDENGKIVLNISKPYAWVGT